mgnify:CR=1 FL=1
MNEIKLSVVIITYNEEKNIERCIKSVIDIADEIVIVDSFSTDKTKEICLKYNVKFIEHKFDGHIEQKNFAITQAKYPYILSLDADEEISLELKEEIKKVKQNWRYDGYYIRRLNNYCGKWIKYGGWNPDWKLRLWYAPKGKWQGINPHDKFILEKNSKTSKLNGYILHYSYNSISEHIKQIEYFTSISAINHPYKNHFILNLKIIINPIWKFIKDYLIKLGFLDGYYGLIIAILSSFATFLKYAKIIEIKRNSKKQLKYETCKNI